MHYLISPSSYFSSYHITDAGNMKYNEYNTAALNAVGGKTSGLTMTVATMQLGVCAIYALIMWTIKLNPAKIFGLQAPEKQSAPKSTKADLMKSIPLAFCAAGAHAATVFALGGDPLFGQIGKFCLLLFGCCDCYIVFF